METRELAVAGALEVALPVFPDRRGSFRPLYEEADWSTLPGVPPFRAVRSGLSVNRAGVVRGVHYAVPGRDGAPATAKLVVCVAGEALDLVVDVRAGSPTFGRHDTVRLTADADRTRAVYCPPGIGHAFAARTEGTVLLYLLSTPYRPADETAVSVLDPALGLPLPRRPEPVLSDADRAAPTLAEALDRGLLPAYRPPATTVAQAGSATGSVTGSRRNGT
ncbi:dTDP-4-dehydrorhamnose 3,5-epimerase family protein [Streptomyces sp. NPDC047097]|uniref:dTDP-4-dehydrorhamnose 3,5-epimerase family protein n=1 Tax=Streptomyces sp. NPDC047097 TaxID=3155260 RepID=UPI00340AB61B